MPVYNACGRCFEVNIAIESGDPSDLTVDGSMRLDVSEKAIEVVSVVGSDLHALVTLSLNLFFWWLVGEISGSHSGFSQSSSTRAKSLRRSWRLSYLAFKTLKFRYCTGIRLSTFMQLTFSSQPHLHLDGRRPRTAIASHPSDVRLSTYTIGGSRKSNIAIDA